MSMTMAQCRSDVNIKMLSIMKMKKRVNTFFSNVLMLSDSVNNFWNYGSQTGQDVSAGSDVFSRPTAQAAAQGGLRL